MNNTETFNSVKQALAGIGVKLLSSSCFLRSAPHRYTLEVVVQSPPDRGQIAARKCLMRSLVDGKTTVFGFEGARYSLLIDPPYIPDRLLEAMQSCLAEILNTFGASAAAEATASERERCAKLIESGAGKLSCIHEMHRDFAAAAIRAGEGSAK